MGINFFMSFFKKFRRITLILTIFGILLFLVLTFLAGFLYPGGYDYFGYYFSDLGAITARNGESNSISRSLYVVAFTIIAVAFIPFWISIRSLFDESNKEKNLSTLGSLFGVLSSPCMIGVALFPMDVHLDIHFSLVLVFVTFFILASLLYSIAIILNRNYSNYFGIIAFILLVISLVASASSFTDPNAILGAFLQKLATYGFILWTIIPIYLGWGKRP